MFCFPEAAQQHRPRNLFSFEKMWNLCDLRSIIVMLQLPFLRGGSIHLEIDWTLSQ